MSGRIRDGLSLTLNVPINQPKEKFMSIRDLQASVWQTLTSERDLLDHYGFRGQLTPTPGVSSDLPFLLEGRTETHVLESGWQRSSLLNLLMFPGYPLRPLPKHQDSTPLSSRGQDAMLGDTEPLTLTSRGTGFGGKALHNRCSPALSGHKSSSAQSVFTPFILVSISPNLFH